MEFDKIKDIVRTVAPAAASLLGTPFAGAAVSVLSKILLGKDAASEDEIVEAIKAADPDKLVDIRKADNELKAKALEAGVRTEEIHAEDRSSAREMHAEMKDVTTTAMAWLIMAAFFLMVAFVLSGLTKGETVLAGTLIGYVAAKADMVVAFYYGSSKGERQEKVGTIGERLASILPLKRAA